MPSLAGSNFASGFVGSMANAFAAKQQRARDEDLRQRQNSIQLAQFLINSGQVGDVADLQPLLGHAMPEIFGDKAKKGGKNGIDPAQTIGDILNKSLKTSQGTPLQPGPAATPSAAPAAPAAPVANPQPGGALDTGTPEVAPAALPSSQIAIPPAPPPRRTLAGVPLLSPEEVTQRAVTRANATRAQEIQAQVDLARRILPNLQQVDKDFTLKDALDYVVNKQFQRTGGVGTATFQSVAGEVPDGKGGWKNVNAVFDRQKGQYLDADTHDPLPGFRHSTSTGSLGTDREALAHEMFNKRAGQLTDQEMAQVNAALPGRAATMAGAKTTATEEAKNKAELDKPIGTTAGQQYNLPPTTPLRELANTPGFTEAEKSKVTSLSMADDSVKAINDLITKVFPDVKDRSPLMARSLTAIDLATKNFARDADYVKLNSEIGLAAINIARIAGETGRVPVQLVDKAQKALADLSLTGGDTRESALAKLEVVKDLLKSARENAPGATKPTASAPVSAPNFKLVNGKWVTATP